MSRKKNKNRPLPAAPAPAAQAFTDLEDNFFQAADEPETAASSAALGAESAVDTRPRHSDPRAPSLDEAAEVAYDASLFDYSANNDDEEEEAGSDDDEEMAEEDLGEGGESEAPTEKLMRARGESAPPPVAEGGRGHDATSLTTADWMNQGGLSEGLAGMAGLDADGYGGGIREDLIDPASGALDPFQDRWGSGVGMGDMSSPGFAGDVWSGREEPAADFMSGADPFQAPHETPEDAPRPELADDGGGAGAALSTPQEAPEDRGGDPTDLASASGGSEDSVAGPEGGLQVDTGQAWLVTDGDGGGAAAITVADAQFGIEVDSAEAYLVSENGVVTGEAPEMAPGPIDAGEQLEAAGVALEAGELELPETRLQEAAVEILIREDVDRALVDAGGREAVYGDAPEEGLELESAEREALTAEAAVVGIADASESLADDAAELEEAGASGYLASSGELESLTDEDEGGQLPDAAWAELGDSAEVADPALLESGDPGDLPEPPAAEAQLQLPEAEVPPDLGWDVPSDEAEAAPASADASVDEGADAAEAAPVDEPTPVVREEVAAEPAPLWDIPAYAPAPEPELEVEDESAFAAPAPSPSYTTSLRFEAPQAEKPAPTGGVISLDEQFQEARQLLAQEAELALPETRAAYLLEIGRLLLGKGQPEEARAIMRESLDAREAFAPALRVLSQLDRAEACWEELIDDLETQALAATSDEQRASALVAAAEIKLQHLDKVAQAQADLEEALEAAPGDLYILQLLNALHRQSGNWEGVAATLKAMVPRLPGGGRVLVYHQLGELYLNQFQQPARAAEWFSGALELDPGFVPSALALEEVLRSEGDLTALEAHYREVAKRSSGAGGVQAWLRVADLSAELERPGAVMEALEQALTLDAHNAFLRREYQGWLARTADWNRYVQSVREELEHVSDDRSRALILLALSQLQEQALRNPVEALQAVEEALAIRPDWRVAREEELRLLAELEDWERLAQRLQEAALAESSGRCRAARYFQAGLVFERRLGEGERARDCFGEAVTADPGRPIYGWTLRRSLEDGGRWTELNALVASGAVSWPFQGSFDTAIGELELRGAVAEFGGNAAGALEAYGEAVAAGARSPLALGGLIRLMSLEGDWEGLVGLLERLEGEAADPAVRALVQWERARLLAERLAQPEEAALVWDAMLEEVAFLPALWARAGSAWRAGDVDGYRAARTGEQAVVGEPVDPHLEALGEALYWARRGHPGPFERLASDPADTLALDLHEWWLHELGDTAALVRLFGVRLERPIDVRQARYLQLRRASWLERAGEREGALVEVANAVSEGAHDEVTLNRLERLSRQLGQAEQLQELLRRVAESSEVPDAGLALRMARNLEQQLHSPAGSLAEYRRAGWLDSGNFEALEGAARLAAEQGDSRALAEALAERAQRLEHAADQAAQLLLAGRAFLAADDEARAEEVLTRALEAGVLKDQAFELVAGICRNRGDVDGLAELYEPWIAREADPVLRDCWVMELADQLEGLGAIDPATKLFERLGRKEAYLPATLRLERIHLASENWEGYVTALESRAGVVKDEAGRQKATERAMRIRAEWLHDPWAREQELQQVLSADPTDDTAVDAFRVLLAEQERWTDLAVALDELAQRAGNAEQKIRRLLDVGWVYANKLDDLEAAFDRYQDALDLNESDQEAIAALKEICERREDWNGMVATLARQSLGQGPEERVETYREIARIWDEKLNEPGTAVDANRKVLEINPDDRSALAALTELHRRLRQWPQFVDAAERLIEVRRDEDPALLNEIGITLARRLDDPERAVPFLLRALARGHGDLEVLRGVAERFEARGSWREACELYGRVAEASPDRQVHIDLYLRVAGIAQENLGDLALAIRSSEQVSRLEPDHLPVQWSLAQLYDDAGRTQDALRTLDTLAGHPAAPGFLEALSPGNRLAFHRRYGVLLQRADLKEEAAAHFEAALRLAPGNPELLELLAALYQSLERWDRYAAIIQAELDAEPDAGGGVLEQRYEALGKAYRAAGNLEAALDAFNRLKELVPTRVDVYLMMAEIYFERQAWNTLLSLYNSVIKHSTEVEHVVAAYLRKADILDERLAPTDSSYVAKAVLHYEKALQYDKRNAYAMLRLAEIALRGRQFQKAADWLKRVLAVDPTPAQLGQTHLLGGILCAEAQKDPTTAMANFRKAAVISPPVDGLIEALAAAVEESPGNLENLLGLYRQVAPPREFTPGCI